MIYFQIVMSKFKKMIRVLGLVFLIILALSGVGIGAVLNPRRERMDNEVHIELVEKGLEDEKEIKE